jgi:SSS family solute:Na+ symporter
MEGLVYGLTKLPSESHLPLWKRPIFWAAVKAAVFVVLSVAFW